MRSRGNPPRAGDDPGNTTDPNLPDELLANLRSMEDDEPTKPGLSRPAGHAASARAPDESYPGFNGRLKREPRFQAESGGRSAARYAGEGRPVKRHATQPDEPAVILNQTVPIPIPLSRKTLPYQDKILPFDKTVSLDKTLPYEAEHVAPTPPGLTPQKDIPTFVPEPPKKEFDIRFWARGLLIAAGGTFLVFLIAIYVSWSRDKEKKAAEAAAAEAARNAVPSASVAVVEKPPPKAVINTPLPPEPLAPPPALPALPPVATPATPQPVAPPVPVVAATSTSKGQPAPAITARRNTPEPAPTPARKGQSGQAGLQNAGKLPALPKAATKPPPEVNDIELTSKP